MVTGVSLVWVQYVVRRTARVCSQIYTAGGKEKKIACYSFTLKLVFFTDCQRGLLTLVRQIKAWVNVNLSGILRRLKKGEERKLFLEHHQTVDPHARAPQVVRGLFLVSIY